MASHPIAHSTEFDDQQIVAANIRALMGRHRVSQEELAKVIGVRQPQLSDRLNGHVNISVRELGLIARYFGKDMVDLVTVGKLAVVQGGRSSGTDDPQQKLPFLRSLP